ncbi:MAG TPA: hypothetical protein VFK43_11630, partial [Acidimicrobiales bacterium]|nr:hypothetical protein [Acidimicrobiales bacterium]
MTNGRALATAAVGLLAMVGAVAPAPVSAAPGAITEYDLSPGFNVPRDITTGRDGNMWFTELVGNRIGRVTRSGAITEFPLPPGHRGPFIINPGPLQSLWFTEIDAGRIGRITYTGAVTEYPLPDPGSGPLG